MTTGRDRAREAVDRRTAEEGDVILPHSQLYLEPASSADAASDVWELPVRALVEEWAKVPLSVRRTIGGRFHAALEAVAALVDVCPRDTDGDGNCGMRHCPTCHPERIR